MAPDSMTFAAWGLRDATLEPLAGGYNSHTWTVHAGGRRYVAKRVAERDAFEAGLSVAERLEERGLSAGGPIRTSSGGLTVASDGEWLALLRYAPGRQVAAGTRERLETWGRAMGRVHSLLAGQAPPANVPSSTAWIDVDSPFLAIAEWLRPALVAALEEVAGIPGLTHGIVHGDGCQPLVDEETGTVSVIDWGAASYGPLLYDVGVARFYFEGDFAPFLEAYRAEAPVRETELAHVDAFVRLRAAIGGWYFAWRIHTGYTVGADDDWNRAGLEEARVSWDRLRA